MLSIGRIFAGEGWRYLWEQVAAGGEDYYLAGVAAGELPGRWGGAAASLELGLAGEVTEAEMRRVFGELADPVSGEVLGNPPRAYRSVEERLVAARTRHDTAEARRWAARRLALADADAARVRIEAEEATQRAEAAERWSTVEAGIRRGGERQAVAGFDLTYSPPKSVSVLWAAAPTPQDRETIWRAHREGVAAAMGYVEREAGWSRTGFAGVRQVDTTGFTAAAFDHRMSRTGDVQIHTHVAVLNRVRCADGEWRTTDSRAVYKVAAAAGAIYDRVREAALERDLGVRHAERKPGGPREIVGVDDDVCRLFSSRRVQIEGKLADLVAAWRTRHPGTEPSQWVLSNLSAWATLATRPHKDSAETTTDALERWEAQTRAELGTSLARVWEQATNPGDTSPAQVNEPPADDGELIGQAVSAVDTAKSTWTRYDLAREITRRMPTDPGLDPADRLARIDHLVGAALDPAGRCGVLSLAPTPAFDTPAELRRQGDGESVYASHGATRYTTHEGVAAEWRLVHATRDTTGGRIAEAIIDQAVTAARLDPDQAAAARAVLSSGRRLDAMIGPAGAGKTTTMRAVAEAWTADGREVLGVAVAENAARVLAEAAGIRAVNAAKLVYEHTQRAADDKRRPWWQQYKINPGSLVILDEAGMASRSDVDALARICADADAKLLLVGDPQQLESPEAAGSFALVAGHVGVQLGNVRRFTHAWEAAASLHLRAGDPTVLDDYDRRGRIHGGTDTEMEDLALANALADRALGKAVYLLADTKDTAARLAGRVRAHLVTIGRVDDTNTVALTDGNRAGRGDRIVTRDNDRLATTADGRFVANRDTWEVLSVAGDGGLQVTRIAHDQRGKAAPIHALHGAVEVIDLDAPYVSEHVQLEYAGTVHAAQGANGATAHALFGTATTRHAAYTALTRGAEENHAYVVTTRLEGADTETGPADPLAVLAAIVEREDRPEHAAAITVQASLAAEEAGMARLYRIWQDLVATHETVHAQDALTAAVNPDLATAILASPAWPALAARLRRIDTAGIDPAAALINAVRQRSLQDADDLASVLHWRLRHHDRHPSGEVGGEQFAQLSPAGDDPVAVTARQVGGAMDRRIQTLAAAAESEPPGWAAALGPVPTDLPGRETWRARAGVVAGYREAFDITTVDDPLGPPPPQDRADAHAWWTRAVAALDPTRTTNLADQPTEHLEAIVEQARTAIAGAPAPVADTLRTTAVALRAARTAAGLAVSEDRTADEPVARAEYLARQLDQLETAQTERDTWTATTAVLRAEAHAAQVELDARADAHTDRPYADLDTPTLVSRLGNARIRSARATDTAADYEHRARIADRQAAETERHLAVALETKPALTAARRQVEAEQAAATRITDLHAQLADTHYGIPTIRGAARAELVSELGRLQGDHPALSPATDLNARWETLTDHATTADRDHLTGLQHRQDQHLDDAAWYRNTATHIRTDAERAADTIDTLTAELTVRAGQSTPTPSTPAPAQQTPPAPTVGVEHIDHVAYQQAADTIGPPQETL